MRLKKSKISQNRTEKRGSHIDTLRKLKSHTDRTLPIVRERKELGLDMTSGISMEQDIHYEDYVKVKFGIKDIVKEKIVK